MMLVMHLGKYSRGHARDLYQRKRTILYYKNKNRKNGVALGKSES